MRNPYVISKNAEGPSDNGQDSLVNSRLEKIKDGYLEDSLCMGEYLAAESADGLTLEQAFELYVRAKSWADDDVFQVIRDTETFVL